MSLRGTYLYAGLIAAANGVVIATEKKLPSILVDETSVSIFYGHIDELSLSGCNYNSLFILPLNDLIYLSSVSFLPLYWGNGLLMYGGIH